jgi:hypothetical protein
LQELEAGRFRPGGGAGVKGAWRDPNQFTVRALKQSAMEKVHKRDGESLHRMVDMVQRAVDLEIARRALHTLTNSEERG